MFAHSLAVPETGFEDWLKTVPDRTAVFALFGRDSNSKPYISKTANLRRRVKRLVGPQSATAYGSPSSKRLHLGGRVARLEYTEAGSPFATLLLLLRVNRKFYGERARERLHLRPPALLRLASENAYPRVYVTNRVTQKALASTYGPFASRATAERYLDESLNFFELRRCTQELDPDPAFPGCVYSEMKMCLAPCFRGCTDERYAEETQRVRANFATRGESAIRQLEGERDAASDSLDYERAARLHQRIEKMRAVAQQAAPLVHPLAELDGIILQPAGPQQLQAAPITAKTEKMSNRALQTEASHVAVFLVRRSIIFGPAFFSVDGMRHPNERAGSTSLFAHPTLLEPTPLESSAAPVAAAGKAPRGELEQRLQTLLEKLETEASGGKLTAGEAAEHLSLLARWYYRPAAQRIGEIFFRGSGGDFLLSQILRGISRVYCGQSAPVEPVSQASSRAPT